MIFFVIKPHKWQLALESITSPPCHVRFFISGKRKSVRINAADAIYAKKLRHCLNNDGDKLSQQ